MITKTQPPRSSAAKNRFHSRMSPPCPPTHSTNGLFNELQYRSQFKYATTQRKMYRAHNYYNNNIMLFRLKYSRIIRDIREIWREPTSPKFQRETCGFDRFDCHS